MNVLDLIILLIDIILTIISCVGAAKSVKYFRKSKHITVFAKTNKASNDLDKMISLLRDALESASIQKRGFNSENAVRNIGKQLGVLYDSVNREIPSEYSAKFRSLQKNQGLDLPQYINSLIDGSAMICVDERKTLDRHMYDLCQECLWKMQDFFKTVISDEEEKLK